LERQADCVANFRLAHAQQGAALAHAGTDMNIDVM
jgi:hypothetical protein